MTAHRAQGITVDTAHVVVTPSTTRENLYVSMTRGRDSNIAYVALDQPDDSHSTPEADDVTARTVLYGVLQHSGADLSATQTIEAEYELHGGIDRLAAELETIAAEAQHDRFVDLLSRSGLTAEQHAAVVESTAFGPLTAALRRAEAYHHDLERLVPRSSAATDSTTPTTSPRCSATASTSSPRSRRVAASLRPRLIAGLIPEPLGAMSAEDRQAIDERKELIESRARALAEDAVAGHEAWTRRLGPRPVDAGDGEAWLDAATTVAAYRDRYKITSDLPVGGGAKNDAQRADRQRALAALRAAALGGARRARHAVAVDGGSSHFGSIGGRVASSSTGIPGAIRDRQRPAYRGSPNHLEAPMLILLALPVIVAVAAMHRYLQFYAPTNLLVAPRARSRASVAYGCRAHCARGRSGGWRCTRLGEAVVERCTGVAQPRRARPRLGRDQGGVVALATALRTLRSVYTQRSGTGLARLM